MSFMRSRSESGQVSALVIIIGGFAVVALLAGLWIGNTAAGLSADAAQCIAGASSAPGPSCLVGGGSGNTNAQAADNGRVAGPAWIDPFGANESATSAAVRIAKENFELGLLRFGGLKLTVSADSSGYLNQLQNASSKAAALAALQNLKSVLDTAWLDGEVTRSNSTLAYGANRLSSVGHEATTGAYEAQALAETGNSYLRAAQTQVDAAINGYSTLTLAQLRAYASPISANLTSTTEYYPAAMGKINETLGKL